MSAPLVLGIDVGGTKLAGVALDGTRVVAERRVQLDNGPLVDQVVSLARDLLAGDGASLEAIGIAVPGQVDTRTGVIEMAVNLEARDLPMGPMVSDALGAPCHLEHDARAVAAWLANEAGDGSSLTYLSVGTGVSAGVVLDGRLLHGSDGLAGEIGHLLADPAGPRCGCGLVGCLEAIASGPAIARASAHVMAEGAVTSMPPMPTTAQVYEASAAGDPTARRIVERAAMHLAAAIRGLALSFGPTRVVVGGGVTHAGDAFVAPLRAAIEQERHSSTLVARALRSDAVELLDMERPAGALGAAAVARMHMEARREVGR